MTEHKSTMEHTCEKLKDAPFTVENIGDGWYLYNEGNRGNNPINFCPCCGTKLTDEEEE